MNSFYADHVLARSIASERISHREPTSLLSFNPIKELVNAYQNFIESILEKVPQPVIASVYCTEFAPSC